MVAAGYREEVCCKLGLFEEILRHSVRTNRSMNPGVIHALLYSTAYKRKVSLFTEFEWSAPT